MTQKAPFGRRGLAAPSLARQAASAPAASFEIVLTPEQRALLLGGDAVGAARNEAQQTWLEHSDAPAAPWSRRAGFAACAASTCLVAAFTLVGKPHDSLAALPPLFEPAAKEIVAHASGGWFGAASILWSIFVIASNLGLNLWLTHRLCAIARWRGLPAFVASGAAMSAAIACLTAVAGLGESEIGYSMEALSGGGAAFLYRLLEGGGRRAG